MFEGLTETDREISACVIFCGTFLVLAVWFFYGEDLWP
jgi:hypothetical protein